MSYLVNWRHSESQMIPEEVDDFSSASVVFLRKNISAKYRDDVLFYSYDETKVRKAVFEKNKDTVLVELRQAKEQDILQLMVAQVAEHDEYAPPIPRIRKEGYVPRKIYDPEAHRTMWVLEPIPGYTSEDGTYLNPYHYTEGMEVTEGYFYTDDDDIWEAIQTGTPLNFFDDRYFDIKGVI